MAISFLLSGLEAALLSVNRVRIRNKAKFSIGAAKRLEKLSEDSEQLLISILLLNTTIDFVVFAAVVRYHLEWFGDWGYGFAVLFSLPVFIWWIEILPKSLFRRFPYRSLVTFVPLLRLIHFGVSPVLWIARTLKGSEKSKLPEKPEDQSEREDFLNLTKTYHQDGQLGAAETRMIRKVIEFNSVTVEDVMVPLNRTEVIPQNTSVESVKKIASKTKMNQYPVLAEDGDLIGVIDVFQLQMGDIATGTASDHMRDLVTTAPDESATSLIKKLRQKGVEIAAVYDTSGKPKGIVNSEDLLREMIGLD